MLKISFKPVFLVVLFLTSAWALPAGFAKTGTKSKLEVVEPPAELAERQAQSEDEISDDSDIFYSFSEHLYGADASILVKGKEVLGKWIDESFLFKGYGKEAAAKLVPVTLDERRHKAIAFNPVQKGYRRLRFSDVPPASKLHLYYRVESPGLSATSATPTASYLYFKILLGSHELKRLRISSQDKDWKSVSFDLGVVSFLLRDLVVTFELVGDNDQVQFSFFGDLQP